jgi:putative PEP-CTERM system TPR-repeat lipoprotein
MNKHSFKMLLLAGTISAVLAGCGDNKTTTEYLKSSADLLAKNQTNAAIIELKNGISKEPNDTKLRFSLGQIYLQVGDLDSAEKELQRALKDLNYTDQVVPLLARVYQLEANEEQLDELVDQYSEKITDITKLQLFVYRSILYSQLGKNELAKEALKQAILISEDNAYSQLADAWYKSSTNETDDALRIANKLLNESPELSDVLLLQAHLYASKADYMHAAENYGKYSTQHPQQYQIKMFEANSLMAADKVDDADNIATELLKLFPKHPFVNLLKAQVSYRHADYSAAKEYANISLQSSDSMMARLVQGLSAYQLKEYEQAYQSLRTVVSSLPSDNSVHKLFASLQLQLGYQNDALQSFEQLKNLDTNDVTLLQNASIAFAHAGNNEEADRLIDRALEISPEKAELLMQKGMIKLNEQDKTGLALLQEALKLDPELKVANITLAAQYLAEDEYDKALEIAKKWQSTQSGMVQGVLLEGVIYSQQGNVTLATKKFNEVLKEEPNNIAATYYLGLLAFQEKNAKAATDYFERVLTLNPQHVDAVRHLILMNLASENKNELTDFFTQLQLKYPNNLSVVFAQAANLTSIGNTQGAIELILKYKDSDLVTEEYWFNLASLYIKNNQSNKAKEIYQNLLNKNPKDNKARLSLLGMLAKEKNYDAIVLEADKAIVTEPSDDRFTLIKARYLLKQHKSLLAKPLVEQLIVKHPDSINVKRLYATLSTEQKDYDKAVKLWSEVYESTKSSTHVIEYAKALKTNQQLDKAILELQNFLKDHTDDTSVRVLLAQYQITTSPEKSLENYYIVLKKAPNNIVLLNNIAWSELQLGQLENAEKHAKQAYILAPEMPQIIDTYGLVLLKKNDKKALDILEKAYHTNKNDDDITYHYAQALAINGQHSQLKALLESANIKNKQTKEKIQQLLESK